MGTSSDQQSSDNQGAQVSTLPQETSNQFQQMMAQQQRARMEQLSQRGMRQQFMAQNFGGAPQQYADIRTKMQNDFMGLLSQLKLINEPIGQAGARPYDQTIGGDGG